jgi:serine/threonine protein kinase
MMELIVVTFVSELRCGVYGSQPSVLPAPGWDIIPRAANRALVLVSPFQKGTTVLDQLESLSNLQILIVADGIRRGMAHIHALHIVHRDLKPLNILLDGQRRPRIGHLGWTKPGDEKQSGVRGTERYLAPEFPDPSTTFPMALDVHSYAILLWELVTRVEYKFSGDRRGRPSAAHFAAQNSEIHLDEGFLAKCWAGDATKPATFADIVSRTPRGSFPPTIRRPSAPARQRSAPTAIRICGFCSSRHRNCAKVPSGDRRALKIPLPAAFQYSIVDKAEIRAFISARCPADDLCFFVSVKGSCAVSEETVNFLPIMCNVSIQTDRATIGEFTLNYES